MSKNQVGVNVLADSIIKCMKEYTQYLPFDRTVQGRVTSVLGNNKYSVQIHGNIYTIPSANDLVYSVNENVWVTIIQNDEKNKIIIGRKRA